MIPVNIKDNIQSMDDETLCHHLNFLSYQFCVNADISKEDENLISCAKDSLYYAIDVIEEGMRFKELSAILEKSIRLRGFVPLHSF